MAELIFELTKVNYSHLGKIPALLDIDLTISAGAKIGIIGANGTGKSTLLAMLDGLIFPDSGSAYAFGEELKESTLEDRQLNHAFRKKVGFVFQNPDAQLFCPTVRDDIQFGPLHLGVPRAEILERVGAVAEDLRITHLLDRSPHHLSMGEKKKAAIATALVMQPQVLILDEPTAGLDPRTTHDIVDRLLAENAAGKTILTATHDLHIVEEISDVVHVFDAGHKIVRSGSPNEILPDANFLEENNLARVLRHRRKF